MAEKRRFQVRIYFADGTHQTVTVKAESHFDARSIVEVIPHDSDAKVISVVVKEV